MGPVFGSWVGQNSIRNPVSSFGRSTTPPSGVLDQLPAEDAGPERRETGRVVGVASRPSRELEELSTDVRDAPMSGGVLFEARAVLDAPPTTSTESLRAMLEGLADELMVEIRLSDD